MTGQEAIHNSFKEKGKSKINILVLQMTIYSHATLSEENILVGYVITWITFVFYQYNFTQQM